MEGGQKPSSQMQHSCERKLCTDDQPSW